MTYDDWMDHAWTQNEPCVKWNVEEDGDWPVPEKKFVSILDDGDAFENTPTFQSKTSGSGSVGASVSGSVGDDVGDDLASGMY